MKISAVGNLSHHFHGEYRASVLLTFESARQAALAQRKLGEAWTWRGGKSKVLTWSGDFAAVEALDGVLRAAGALAFSRCGWEHCKDQCAGARIGGMPHSIDVGPLFTLSLEVEDPAQGGLFAGYASDDGLPPEEPSGPKKFSIEITERSWFGVEIPEWLRVFDCREGGHPPRAPWGPVLWGGERAEVDLGLRGPDFSHATSGTSCSGYSDLRRASDTQLAKTVADMVATAAEAMRKYRRALENPAKKGEGGSAYYRPVAVELSNYGWSVICDERECAVEGFR